MDKNTMSAYGWIIVATTIIAILFAAVIPFANSSLDLFNRIPDKIVGTHGDPTINSGSGVLGTPKNLTLSEDYILTFDPVANADSYIITTKANGNSLMATHDEPRIDLSVLKNVSKFAVVEVVATSDNPSYKNGGKAIYVINNSLNTPTGFSLSKDHVLTFDRVNGANKYIVTLADGTKLTTYEPMISVADYIKEGDIAFSASVVAQDSTGKYAESLPGKYGVSLKLKVTYSDPEHEAAPTVVYVDTELPSAKAKVTLPTYDLKDANGFPISLNATLAGWKDGKGVFYEVDEETIIESDTEFIAECYCEVSFYDFTGVTKDNAKNAVPLHTVTVKLGDTATVLDLLSGASRVNNDGSLSNIMHFYGWDGDSVGTVKLAELVDKEIAITSNIDFVAVWYANLNIRYAKADYGDDVTKYPTHTKTIQILTYDGTCAYVKRGETLTGDDLKVKEGWCTQHKPIPGAPCECDEYCANDFDSSETNTWRTGLTIKSIVACSNPADGDHTNCKARASEIDLADGGYIVSGDANFCATNLCPLVNISFWLGESYYGDNAVRYLEMQAFVGETITLPNFESPEFALFLDKVRADKRYSISNNLTDQYWDDHFFSANNTVDKYAGGDQYVIPEIEYNSGYDMQFYGGMVKRDKYRVTVVSTDGSVENIWYAPVESGYMLTLADTYHFRDENGAPGTQNGINFVEVSKWQHHALQGIDPYSPSSNTVIPINRDTVFTITLVPASNTSTSSGARPAPGLYAADGTRLATWEQLTGTGGMMISQPFPILDDSIENGGWRYGYSYSEITDPDDPVKNPRGYYSPAHVLRRYGKDMTTNPGQGKSLYDLGVMLVFPEKLAEADKRTVYYVNENLKLVSEKRWIIGDCAFYGCDNLQTVILPSNLQDIRSSAFANCTNLVNISLPNSVINIEAYAFQDCKNLKSITIPDGVKNIYAMTFSDCNKLASVTLGKNILVIGARAFSGCVSLINLDMSAAKDLETIDLGAFSGCASLTEVSIPGNIRWIGVEAFSNCSRLVSVKFGGSGDPVKIQNIWIGGNAFALCPNLYTFYFEGSEEDWRSTLKMPWWFGKEIKAIEAKVKLTQNDTVVQTIDAVNIIAWLKQLSALNK